MTQSAASTTDLTDVPDEREPGPELNALIAAQVMGYTVKHDLQGPYILIGDGDHRWPVPSYSTEIATAWLIIRHLAVQGVKTSVLSQAGGRWGCWLCVHVGTPQEAELFKSAGTAPHAICLAALEVAPLLARKAAA